MPTTTTSKIQVRRGPLSDLPILDEGEFGYALDYHRLFIGNTPLSFTGNGKTKRYTVQDRTILPNQISVLVDNSEVNIGVEYTLEETDIVFANAPHAAEEIFYTVIGSAPSRFVGNGVTNTLLVQGYSEGNELCVVSYKNYDPVNYVPLDVTRVFASTDPDFPDHLELSGTSGLEVGQLFVVVQSPLPGLVAGQNYYIRAIHGNRIMISLTEDPGTPCVSFNQTVSGLSRARAGGDLLQVNVNYTFDGSTITFLNGSIPEGNADVKISFNTELQVQSTISPHFRLPLDGSAFSKDTGLSISISEANTALIDYSIRTADNLMRVGTIQLITDGVNGSIQDSAGNAVPDGIHFGFRIESNRLYLTYTNSRTQSANFYYSVKLWNTI